MLSYRADTHITIQYSFLPLLLSSPKTYSSQAAEEEMTLSPVPEY